MQVVDQLCTEFEREVSQMTQDIVRYRGELARCADLLAYQLGKEKQYHNMLAACKSQRGCYGERKTLRGIPPPSWGRLRRWGRSTQPMRM
ncbi:unnamed protein product [Durusdinium trenchii]|uniref:Uncharacterized protein n=1 Tax=Durusdinium trenchii TaxID=1381693 RepID=A0ABP0SQ21_9DINO